MFITFMFLSILLHSSTSYGTFTEPYSSASSPSTVITHHVVVYHAYHFQLVQVDDTRHMHFVHNLQPTPQQHEQENNHLDMDTLHRVTTQFLSELPDDIDFEYLGFSQDVDEDFILKIVEDITEQRRCYNQEPHNTLTNKPEAASSHTIIDLVSSSDTEDRPDTDHKEDTDVQRPKKRKKAKGFCKHCYRKSISGLAYCVGHIPKRCSKQGCFKHSGQHTLCSKHRST